MSVLVRRFIIVTLICVNFAILFAALVGQPTARTTKMRALPSECLPFQPRCGASA